APPRLVLADGLNRPCLAGIRRPVIVIPVEWVAEQSAREWRLILAHELAHARRRDLPWNWLPAAAGALFFFHPLAWLARRRANLAQEIACDALALQATGAAPAHYGALLLKVAARPRLAGEAGLLTLAVARGYRSVERRLTAMQSFGKET